VIRTKLTAFAAGCYEFVVGDDWRLAVTVVIALALTAAAAAATVLPAWLITPVLVGAALVYTIARMRPSQGAE
jgi:uncharacterized protein (DUF983 family)